MRRFVFGVLAPLYFSIAFGAMVGCGGGSKSSANFPTPTKVTLTPATSSVELGGLQEFRAAIDPSSAVPVVYTSSNPNVLSFVPAAGGVACAGRWNPTGQICSPVAVGVAEVTATANGVTSNPVTVYVHQHIDTIALSVLNPPTPLPDCVTLAKVTGTQNFLDLQAQAFSNGVDITNTVGSFTFQQTNNTVAKLSFNDAELQNHNGKQITQARVTAAVPGITQVSASLSGVNSLPVTISGHPWFETCQVQSIQLQVGNASTNTSFSIASNGTATLTATVVDRLGNELTSPPITWTSLSPANATISSSGVVTPHAPGGASFVASCTPPTCNIGFQPIKPVFSSTLVSTSTNEHDGAPITGIITGAAVNTTVYATTTQCNTAAGLPISGCQPLIYPVTTKDNVVGTSSTLPSSPNSFVFNPQGTKAFLGSDEGLMVFNPSAASGTNPVTQLSNVTGKVLAVSLDGNKVVVADTKSIPNQVYIVDQETNATNTSLFISGATAAAFSPDGLKAFITAGSTLYVYSTLQALKTVPLNGPANGVAPYANGSLLYLAGGETNAVTMRDACDSSYGLADSVTVARLPALFQAVPDGVHAIGVDSPGLDIFINKVVAPAFATPTAPNATTCPFTVTHQPPEFVNLGQGDFTPLKLILAPDGSRAYILASNLASVFIYNFGVGTVSAIPLAGGPVPLDATLTADGTLLYVGASDGSLHVVSTVSGGDLQQVTFTNNNSTNKGSLCSNIPQTCNPDLIAAKP
jgi:trimeric autotransporter adhesin